MGTELATIQWLWEFHAWARGRLSRTIRRVPDEHLRRPGVIAGGQYGGSVFGTLVHLVDGEESWLARWTGSREDPEPDPAHYGDLNKVIRQWQLVERRRLEFLSGLVESDLQRRPSGAKATLGQTLLHVSNHTTHHRAELCVGLTALGFQPPGLDVTEFVRASARR